MSKSVLPRLAWVGAACAVLTATAAQAAPRPGATPWVITPAEAACRTDLELTGRSGGTAPVVLASDGERLVLRFAKADLPERAFLPIRIDQKPYSNLMQRAADGSGELTLSETTQAAMRKGGTLSIAWLSDEPVSAPLGGSEQGVPDLKTCGAQVAGEAHERAAQAEARRAQAESDARAQAIANAQLQAAHAQQAAADAERQRQQAEADAAQAQARAAYQQQQQSAYQQQQQADYQAQRQRAYEEALRRYNGDDGQAEALPSQPIPYSPPPRWVYRRY